MSTIDRMLDDLCKYGLTLVQAKIYLSLLKLGRTSPTKVAKELKVHRSEIYRVLRELREKRLVVEEKGRPVQYAPVRPEEALDTLLQAREKELEYLKERRAKLVEWLSSQSRFRERRPSVLLVDDDEGIRRTLPRLLSKSGFDVDLANDGSEALKRSRLRLYNLALIDIRLPDMEGTKLLKMLKEDNPELVEIIITGYPSVESAARAIDEGADAYLLKPVAPSDLLAKMREKLKK